jgi:hypothetical protein
MEKGNNSSTVETKSNDAVTNYLERSGPFGIIAIMTIFYTALMVIFSLA